jgi:hypothetical protein
MRRPGTKTKRTVLRNGSAGFRPKGTSGVQAPWPGGAWQRRREWASPGTRKEREERELEL